MRFIKRQTLDRRTANNTTLYSDDARANVYVSPIGAGSLVLPNGTTAQVPATPSTGMMRYNTTTNEVQVYQGSSATWRSIRYKESTQITQQNLGAGNGAEVYFGPLNPAPPTTVQSGATWGGQNIIVVVENVIQLFNTNYTVVQNPSIGAETYTGKTSASASIGATTLYFSTSLMATGASGTGTTATLTFTTKTANPFAVGQTISVTGMTPSAYNGSFTVTAVTTSSVSYASAATGSLTYAGQIEAASTVYPSTNFTGATVTGSAFLQASTLVSSYVADSVTGALISMVISKPTVTGTINADVSLTITEASATGTGYYLYFSSPVPYGKPVTALIGFDQ